jgi:nucleotide-binding universal stress UspA family protein
MNIVVPIDFTDVTIHALRYAVNIAKKMKADLILLHIVKNKIKADEEEDIHRRLTLLGEEIVLKDRPWRSVVRKGSIFEDIGAFAREENAGLVVMGTHGMKGSQKVFGSYAIKVITSADTPFIITQLYHRLRDEVGNILVPIDLRSEDPRILEAAGALAKSLNSSVHILASWYPEKSKQNLSHQIANFAQDFFEERGIEATVKFAAQTKHFDQYLMDYAQEIDAGLIAIINKGEEAYRNLFGSNFDQNLITNQYNIPVLTMDPNSKSSLDALSEG